MAHFIFKSFCIHINNVMNFKYYYEWDSQHGELEGYRASDGQHIEAFDPKTGKQLKPADPKRNIKKCL